MKCKKSEYLLRKQNPLKGTIIKTGFLTSCKNFILYSSRTSESGSWREGEGGF